MSTLAADRPMSDPAPRKQQQLPVHPLITLLKPIASLKLTVSLFAMSMVLVFFGTIAQKNAGIWGVVDQYFWSWYVWIDVQLAVQFGQIFFAVPPDWSTSAKVPFPAGKLIGFTMFFNLLAAHTLQLISLIRVTAKKAKKSEAYGDVLKLLVRRSGIYILHGGILLLFVGEYITREFQVEQNMIIVEGGSAEFTSDTRSQEFAFTTPVEGSDKDTVTVVPAKLVREAFQAGQTYSHPSLPVDLEVLEFYTNSDLVKADPGRPNLATTGYGLQAIAVEKPVVKGTDTDQKIDAASAYVRFKSKPDGTDLGIYLLTTLLKNNEPGPTVDGKSLGVALRQTRFYKPYRLELIQFTFERYLGTNTPKNFASKILLIDLIGPERGPDREVTISMNDPLRHRGETFFQSGVLDGEKGTILQVVRNPGWVLPYLSCVMVTVGMLLHFTIGLVTFVTIGRSSVVTNEPLEEARTPGNALSRLVFGKPRVRLTTGDVPTTGRAIAWVCVGVTALYLLGSAIPRTAESKYDLGTLGALPIIEGGRVKPLETHANVTLRLLNNTEEYKDESDKKRPAIEWYLKTMTGQPGNLGPAAAYRIFRIENDRLLEMMKVERREGLRYSLDELRPRFDALEKAAKKVVDRPKLERDLYDAKVLDLATHLRSYISVMSGTDALILPPEDGKLWRQPADSGKTVDRADDQFQQEMVRDLILRMEELGLPRDPTKMNPEQRKVFEGVYSEAQSAKAQKLEVAREAIVAGDPAYKLWTDMHAAYRERKPDEFNRLLATLDGLNRSALTPHQRFRVGLETYLNRTSLYYKCIGLYVVVFLLTLAGIGTHLVNPGVAEGFRRGAFGVLLLTCLVHTATLFARMYVMDRPGVFVTNLYSSAVFIGWAAVIGCLLVERIFSIGLGNGVGALIGFSTSVVAHNLAASGDTLEMMVAVLDTNFWLATHVTTVTLGYSATYVAGLIGVIYVALGVATPYLRSTVNVSTGGGTKTMELGRVIGMILYGVVCFSVLFSFVGTVLGGIWADQSWGRFWGWDPKENGAVLIVIWNALLLHARWSGLVKDRGFAVLAIVGNMITTWSWFGTNQLGVGLHNYGFSNELQQLCTFLWILHGLLVVVGMTPKRYWSSFAVPATPAA
jgi:ABC-type transport system involved in cytochrome c biogenesis permease subunit